MASAPRPRLTLGISIVGTVLVTLYAVWAYFHIMVLNPLAAVPGLPLEEIWRQVDASQGSTHRILVPAILVLGPLLALALLVVGQQWAPSRPGGIAAGYLWLLVLGAPAEFAASFSPGMNLADTYAISGADASPWGLPLLAISGLALLALIVLGAAIGVRGVRDTGASPVVAG